MEESPFYKAIISNDKKLIKTFLNMDFQKPIKALAYVMLGNDKSASKLIREFEEENPEQKSRYILEANLLILRRNWEYQKLLAITEELHKYYPESFFGNYVLSEIFRKRKQWDFSYKYISKCIELLPRNDNLHIEAAALQIKMKDPTKAVYHLNYLKKFINKVIPYLELTKGSRIFYCIFLFTLLFSIGNPVVLYIVFLLLLLFWIICQSRTLLLPRDLSARSLLCFLIYYLLFIVYVNIINIWS